MRHTILIALLGLILIASSAGCYGGSISNLQRDDGRLLDEQKCLLDTSVEANDCTPFPESGDRKVATGKGPDKKSVGSGTSQPSLVELKARVDRQDSQIKVLIKIARKVLSAAKANDLHPNDAPEADRDLSDDDAGGLKPVTPRPDEDLSELEAELHALVE